jgi:hypothetical protein
MYDDVSLRTSDEGWHSFGEHLTGSDSSGEAENSTEGRGVIEKNARACDASLSRKAPGEIARIDRRLACTRGDHGKARKLLDWATTQGFLEREDALVMDLAIPEKYVQSWGDGRRELPREWRWL